MSMQSMTGYGRAEREIEGMAITAEIKSVNHRYAEYMITIPRYYGFLEDRVRKHLKNCIGRGKISVYIATNDFRPDARRIVINEALAGEYIETLRNIATSHGLSADIPVSVITRLDDVFTVEYKQESQDEIFAKIQAVLDDALSQFVEMRTREGEKLKTDLVKCRIAIEKNIEIIKERAPEVLTENINRIKGNISEILGENKVEESRILTEISIMSDRLCITEELVRMASHLEQFDIIIEQDEPIGRKLDFLLQEMNREVNTIGSKIGDVQIGKTVVELKSDIEKIREQVQNIE